MNEARDVRLEPPNPLRRLLGDIGALAEANKVRAFAVGGCVRDWLKEIASGQDLDVAIEGDGRAFARALAQRLDAPLETHEPFGTATIALTRPRRLRIDVATCRRETYAHPAAYPHVEDATLGEDLKRRDFTINALAMALNPPVFGALKDPFNGVADLKARRLRVLHERSFIDDPSRILRGVRFAQRFGLRWEKETERLMREAIAAGALGRLNAGRVAKEMERMTEEPDPAACFRALGRILRDVGTGAEPAQTE